MGSWCANNLRDLKAWKDENLQLTASSNAAVKLYDGTIRQLVSLMDCDELGGIENSMKKMFEEEPNFFMGNVLKLGLDALSTNKSVTTDSEYANKLNEIYNNKNCTPRERHHALAVYYFGNGSCVEWEKILAEHPNDLLAIKFSHDAYFFLGEKLNKKDSIARVIKKWSPNTPCYSYLHGMYAFGLEECEDYILAEKHARKALELNKYDCWATHAIAHCYEMKSEYSNGINFMESTVENWKPGNMLACHNYWHVALFYLEKGDYETALSLFDQEIYRRTNDSDSILNFVDAASLLMRIQLEWGKDKVGVKRWNSLLPFAISSKNVHANSFNDAHISMVLGNVYNDKINSNVELKNNNVAIDEKNNEKHVDVKTLNQKHIESILQFIEKQNNNDLTRIARDIGLELCEAISNFNNGCFENAFQKMYPIRFQLDQIGGSNAQRDVFSQILIYSALYSKNDEHQNCAKQLIEERNEIKLNSLLSERILKKHLKIL